MIEVLKKIISNVLTALYQPFWYALIMAMLMMFLRMLVKKQGWKCVLLEWWKEFKTNTYFRREFFLAFYTVMILFSTLLNRNMWAYPLENVIGVWGLHNDKGELTTEIIENLALFIPFTVLLFWCFHEKILEKGVKLLCTMWQSVKIVFFFSLSIEFLQLFLRLGTFQLSDLFYNTLGGFVGGLVYWTGHKIISNNKKDL